MEQTHSHQDVLDLCDSIKDVHRALIALDGFFKDIESAPSPAGQAVRKDFQLWGLQKISRMFLLDQYRKLNRIREIYLDEEKTRFGD